MRRVVSRQKAKAEAANQDSQGNAPAEAIKFGLLEDWIGFHLRMAQSASFQSFAREASGMSLSPGRFAILTLIGQNPGISQTALSRANGRDKSTLTPALDDLERRGLVVRERLANDRRSYALKLTKAGQTALDELTDCAARHEANVDRILGPDRDTFMQLLKKLSAELSTDEAEGT